MAVGNRLNTTLAGVLAEGCPGMAGHQPPGRPPFPHQPGSAGDVFRVQPPGNIARVGAVDQPLVAGLRVRRLGAVKFGQFPPRLWGLRRGVIVKAAEILGSPADRFQQFQQGVQFRFVQLHGRGGKQQQAFRSGRQFLKQLQVLVGAAPAGVGDIRKAGPVSFVHNDQVVARVAGQKSVLVLAQPLVGCNQRIGGPGRVGGIRYGTVGIRQRGPGAGLQPRDVDVEFAVQFVLPLRASGFGRQHQQAGHPPLVDAEFRQDAGLDGLAQAHFVGNQQPVGAGMGSVAVEKGSLVRPEFGRHGGNRAGRVITERIPDTLPVGGAPGHILRRQRRFAVAGGVFPQVGIIFVRQRDDISAPAFPLPQGFKQRRLVRGAFPVSPGGEYIKGFVVVLHPGAGFVQAAVKGDAVAGAVGDDADFGVKDTVVGDDGDANVQTVFRHQPGEQFQLFPAVDVLRGYGGQVGGRYFPAQDGGGLLPAGHNGGVSLRRHLVVANQADAPAVGQQPGHPPRRRLQPGRAECVGGAVVADGLRQNRPVELGHEVGAVLRRVRQPKGDVGQGHWVLQGSMVEWHAESRRWRLVCRSVAGLNNTMMPGRAQPRLTRRRPPAIRHTRRHVR